MHASSGIATRHTALPLEAYRDLGDFRHANDLFIEVATDLAERALRTALADAGLDYAAVRQAYAGYVYGDSTCGQRALYEVGMTGPHFEELYPNRAVDASHADVLLDLNRCILCGLCVRASATVDGKNVFAIDGHGIDTRLIVNSPSGLLGDSTLALSDCAARICPVGAILPKRQGFATPIGQRRCDIRPVSQQVEKDAT